MHVCNLKSVVFKDSKTGWCKTIIESFLQRLPPKYELNSAQQQQSTVKLIKKKKKGCRNWVIIAESPLQSIYKKDNFDLLRWAKSNHSWVYSKPERRSACSRRLAHAVTVQTVRLCCISCDIQYQWWKTQIFTSYNSNIEDIYKIYNGKTPSFWCSNFFWSNLNETLTVQIRWFFFPPSSSYLAFLFLSSCDLLATGSRITHSF